MKLHKKVFFFFFFWGGGGSGRVGRVGGQGGCERRIEVFVKIQKRIEKSYTFINSVSCLHLPFFCSQTVEVSEKYTFFSFSYRKA